MKRLIAVMLLLCLVLTGCGGEEELLPPETTLAPTTEATTEATTEPTTEPTEPPVLYRNPLTGQPVDAPVTNRPVAVVINNIYDAQPLHGVGQADVLFEIVAEGGGPITRMLAVYTDVNGVPKIGSIRSARTYLLELAQSFNAFFVHAGGSEYAYKELRTSGYDHLDGRVEAGFYRDKARQSSGYALEHTLFSDGERILKQVEKKGLSLINEEETNYGFQFADENVLQGEPATHIELRFTTKNGKGTFFDYDESTGLYGTTQYFYNTHKKELLDANDAEEVTFKNVIVLFAKTTTDSKAYRMFAELIGEGTGYYACGGQIVPITWKRGAENEPFAYFMEDGTPVTLGVGTTYVGVLATESPVTYE